MRVLVTGGAGFIGSHLCQALKLYWGAEVVVVDNFFTGSRLNVPDFEVVRHDVCDPFHFEVDEIYHLACPASPVHYQRNPARTIRTCVQGTLNALECARNTGAKIVIASTSEVYGDPLFHPQVESHWGNVNPIGVRACYDEGKRCAEALATSYRRQYGVDVRIARIFNTYGPRMQENDGRVVSNFVCQALRGEPITVYGDGKQTRSFMYVSDLVGGLFLLMRKDNDVDAALPFNLGNPVETTVGELAEMVRELTGARQQVEYRPLPEDDPTRRRPDITRAQRLLDWSPKKALRDGLQLTIDDFRERVEVKT
jgi:UDP-glucuronate decarboxylase